MHEREYIQESLSYVLRIQEVQERIKFEFVEILLAFISGWLVFYHTAHEQAEDNRDYLQDLRHKVQKVILTSSIIYLQLISFLLQFYFIFQTRENFEEAREKVTELKTKYMEKRTVNILINSNWILNTINFGIAEVRGDFHQTRLFVFDGKE